MGVTGTADGQPMRVGVPIADIFSGVYSVVGILAALARREKTGRGGYVDAALVNSTVGVLSFQALNYLVSGKIPQRIGNAHPNLVPYQVFPVADGRIIIATGNEISSSSCAASSASRSSRRCRRIRTTKAALPIAPSWSAALRAHRAVQARRAVGQARSRRHSGRPDQRARAGVFRSAGDPSRHEARTRQRRRQGGKIPGVRTPIVLDGAPMASHRPSPRLGEHTGEILREIGER